MMCTCINRLTYTQHEISNTINPYLKWKLEYKKYTQYVFSSSLKFCFFVFINSPPLLLPKNIFTIGNIGQTCRR